MENYQTRAIFYFWNFLTQLYLPIYAIFPMLGAVYLQTTDKRRIKASSFFALLRSVAYGCVGAFGLLRLFFVRAIGDCANDWRSRDCRGYVAYLIGLILILIS